VQGEGYLPPLQGSVSETERAAEGRSAQAQRGRLGTLLVARQGRSPSGGLVTLLRAERGNAFRVGVADGKGPQRRLTEDCGCYAGSSQGGDILPLLG
jgi:hypothetical protein